MGNRPVGFVGVVNAPSGSEVPGSAKEGRLGSADDGNPDSDEEEDEADDEAAAAVVTLTVACAEKVLAPLVCAVTFAVRVTFVPDATADVVSAPATSSVLLPVCRGPRLQTAPLADPHTANVGACTFAALAMLTVTFVPLLLEIVVQAKTAKLAVPPGGTLLFR